MHPLVPLPCPSALLFPLHTSLPLNAPLCSSMPPLHSPVSPLHPSASILYPPACHPGPLAPFCTPCAPLCPSLPLHDPSVLSMHPLCPSIPHCIPLLQVEIFGHVDENLAQFNINLWHFVWFHKVEIKEFDCLLDLSESATIISQNLWQSHVGANSIWFVSENCYRF